MLYAPYTPLLLSRQFLFLYLDEIYKLTNVSTHLGRIGWRIERIISTSTGNRNGDGKIYHKSDEKNDKKRVIDTEKGITSVGCEK